MVERGGVGGGGGAAPAAPLFLPPPRPISVSSGESTLTRELSRQDLSVAGSTHSNGGAAAAFHSGPSNGAGAGRQSSSTSGLAPAAQPGVQPGFDAGVDHHFAAKVTSSWAMLLPGSVSHYLQSLQLW